MRNILILFLLIPTFSFSQGLEGGFVDNIKIDKINRMVVNDGDPLLDKPVTDIIEYRDGLLLFSDRQLLYYDLLEERVNLLEEISYPKALFAQIDGDIVYINFYDENDKYIESFQYNVSSQQLLTRISAGEIVEVFTVLNYRYYAVKNAEGLLQLFTQKDIGVALNGVEGLFLNNNYSFKVDSKSFIYINADDRDGIPGLYGISDSAPEAPTLISLTNDYSYAFVNDQAYYGERKTGSNFKFGSDNGYKAEELVPNEVSPFAYKFFSFGENIFGYYGSPRFDILGEELRDIYIIDTQGSTNVNDYKTFAFKDLIFDQYGIEEFRFSNSIHSILEASPNVVVATNLEEGSFQTLYITSSLEIIIGSELLVTTVPPVSAKVFNGSLASVYFELKTTQVSRAYLSYFDLAERVQVAAGDYKEFETTPYEFEHNLVSAKDINYTVGFNVKNGFELNFLTKATQNGFRVAEEITNDELSMNVLKTELGLNDIQESFSTYPRKLTSINNTLYYLAQLPSGAYNSYYYLYKVNRFPTDISLSANTVSESINSPVLVANLSNVDVDDTNGFQYQLLGGTGGEDNGLFSISGNQLNTTGGFNFEAKSQLNIKIGVQDPHGLNYVENFNISVQDANDAPTDISLTGDKIGENAAIGTKLADISTTDEDAGETFTYTLVDDAGASFALSGSELLTNADFSGLAGTDYNITLRTSDSQGATFDKLFTIGITQNNDAPTDILLSSSTVEENGGTDQLVATLDTSDPDPGDVTFVYALVAGTGDANNNDFMIDNSASPSELRATSEFDFESQESLSVRIRTTDATGANFVKQFQLTVTDANDAPTAILLLNDSINENESASTLVGTLTTEDVDAGDTFTYELVAGTGDTDNIDFSVNNTTGELLQATDGFDFETKDTYSIRVSSTDNSGAVVEEAISVRILNQNEAPSEILLSNSTVPENDDNALIGSIDVNDPDADDTYSLNLPVDTLNNNYFTFGAGGALLLNGVVNFEDTAIPNPLEVVVQATDASGASTKTAFNIAILDVNDAPDSLALNLAEGNIITPKAANETISRILIGDEELGEILSLQYPDQGYNVRLSDFLNNDGLKFAITYDASSQIYFLTAAENGISFDNSVPENNIFEIELMIEDTNHPSGELKTYTKSFTIEVRDENAPIAPRDILLSNTEINENFQVNTNGRIVGSISSVDDNPSDSHTYSLVNNGSEAYDNGLFTVAGGQLSFINSINKLNYDKDSVYQVNIRSTDNDALTVDKLFEIKVIEYVDTEMPAINTSSQPSNVLVDGNSLALNLPVSDWALKSVTYQYAPTLATSFTKEEEILADSYDGTINIIASESDFDAFGMKVKVLATDSAGNSTEFSTYYAYRSLGSENIYETLPDEFIGKGKATKDYRMFSIPYRVRNLDIQDFLEQQLAVSLSEENFQIYQWNPANGSYRNANSLTNFELGKSYWFTTPVENPSMEFGAGNLFRYKPEFNTDSVFVYQLKQGWNQIGNPYPVEVDWNLVTNGTNVGRLHVYGADGYTESNSLPVYGGGFVLVQEDTNLPAILTSNTAARKAEKLAFTWKVDFTLQQGEEKNSGRVGMHPQASIQLDGFDIANPPHFNEYIELDFNKEERYYSNYKSDVIADVSSFIWNFDVHSNRPEEAFELSWENEGIVANQLFLIDLNTLQKIDMAKSTSYAANKGNGKGFKIIYSQFSDNLNLGTLMVGVPIPNPVKEYTSINFNLPDSQKEYQVTAEILDLSGRKIDDLMIDKTLSSGFHYVSWDGKGSNGEAVASGIYIYRIKISGEETGLFTGRILKTN